MRAGRWRRALAMLLLLVFPMALTGCWDQQELDKMFILTGVALDVSDKPGEITVTAQVANIKREGSTSTMTDTEGNESAIIMRTTGPSLLSCFAQLNRNSNHTLMFQHNQIRLLGMELAQQGIKKHLDMIMRDQNARLEVPLAVVDGRGEQVLTAELSQEPISGIFVGQMFDDLAKVSRKYRVRTIDFVHQLMSESTASTIPILKVTGVGDKKEIKLDGLAVFHNDKMIGRLSNEEALGYIWSFGNVKKSNIELSDGSDRAILYITALDCNRKAALREDGGVRITLTINVVAETNEVYGFSQMKPPELLKRLESLAGQEISYRITNCFEIAKGMRADIFEFGTMVYKKYPRQWDGMKDRWDEIFQDIELDIEVKVRIPLTGETVQSLEMEENMR